MRQDIERNKNKQEYQLMQETIKKRPTERRSMARRLLAVAGCGILFGGCAAVTFAEVFPVLADKEENAQQKIELTETQTMEKTEAVSEEQTVESEDTADESQEREKGPLALYEDTYKEVLKISQKAQKSLVTVRGISKEEDSYRRNRNQREDEPKEQEQKNSYSNYEPHSVVDLDDLNRELSQEIRKIYEPREKK